MKYLVALAIAGLIITALLLYALWVGDVINRFAREHLIQLRDEGRLPEGVDIESPNLENFAMRIPYIVEVRHTTARAILRFSVIWAPVVLLACLGLATVFESAKSKD